MGVASLILSLIAFVLGMIPGCGFFMGIIPGILGFIFGIIGTAQKSNNKAPAIIGLILSIFAGLVMIGSLFKDVPSMNNLIVNNNDNTVIQNNTTNNAIVKKVTKENYEKIKEGMTKEQVKEILGEPMSVSESETPGTGKMELNHYQEVFSLEAIDIYYLNNKVYMKNWTQL